MGLAHLALSSMGVTKTLFGCAEWLDIVINTVVKSCRFVPKWGSARRLAVSSLGKKTEPAAFPHLWEGINIGDLRVSYPPGNGRGIVS